MYNDSRDTMAQITALQLDTRSTLYSMATLFTRILNGELPARLVWGVARPVLRSTARSPLVGDHSVTSQ